MGRKRKRSRRRPAKERFIYVHRLIWTLTEFIEVIQQTYAIPSLAWSPFAINTAESQRGLASAINKALLI
jgi:hypothetical protein